MKKILLSAFVIVTFVAYVIHKRTEGSADVNVVIPQPSNVPASPASSTPSTPSTSPVSQGKYKDGAYTGNVTDAFYGNVQVKAIIQNGKIADVQFLQYPNDRRTSIEINSQAMPVLTAEAIKVQSAEVDTVTGATQTSQAFKQSLQSALDQAHT